MLKIMSRACVLMAAVYGLWAGPCTTTTLDQYISLPANVGCTVGSLIMENFSFSVLSSSGAPLTAAATDILVTPLITSEYGLSFSSNKFSESGAQSITYLLTYAEDPTGSIRSLDDELFDPVTAPGRGEVDSIGCLGGMFTALNTCSTGPANITPILSVFDAGTSNQLTGSLNFAPVSVLGVQKQILVTGGGTGNATLLSFGSQSFIPEPGSGWLAAAAVAALLWGDRMRRKRAQVRLQPHS